MIDVAVILVGMNARKFVLECIASIYACPWSGVSFEIVYVDNGSKDGSVEGVQKEFSQVRVIANPSNLGFCPAANQGARSSGARYFYFINDDTLVQGDAIAHLVRYCDGQDHIGTVGSRLIFPDGREQYSGRRFPTLWSAVFGRRSRLTAIFPRAAPVRDYLCMDELRRGEPFAADWVSAAAQIVPREVFWAVGGYADDYYYWHEAVFCYRLRQRGYRVVLDPGSTVIHYEGFGSGPRSPQVQRFHIVNFHTGAFRCYCELNNLRWRHPWFWLLAAAMTGRAALLCLETYVRSAGTTRPGHAS